MTVSWKLWSLRKIFFSLTNVILENLCQLLCSSIAIKTTVRLRRNGTLSERKRGRLKPALCAKEDNTARLPPEKKDFDGGLLRPCFFVEGFANTYRFCYSSGRITLGRPPTIRFCARNPMLGYNLVSLFSAKINNQKFRHIALEKQNRRKSDEKMMSSGLLLNSDWSEDQSAGELYLVSEVPASKRRLGDVSRQPLAR